MIKAFLPQPTASWSSCSMYFTNHSIHSSPKQCFLTLTMCPEFSVHQISQLIVTMSTHKVCYLNFARLLHRTNSTPNSTVGHLLLVSLCMRIIAKLDIQPSYVWICVDISRVGAIDINGIAFVRDHQVWLLTFSFPIVDAVHLNLKLTD